MLRSNGLKCLVAEPRPNIPPGSGQRPIVADSRRSTGPSSKGRNRPKNAVHNLGRKSPIPGRRDDIARVMIELRAARRDPSTSIAGELTRGSGADVRMEQPLARRTSMVDERKPAWG